MNKVDAKKILLESRKVLELADYSALTNTEDMMVYYNECKRLQDLGMKNAGVIGVACPTCYREISPVEKPDRQQCKCGTSINIEDTMNALGFSQFTHSVGARRPV